MTPLIPLTMLLLASLAPAFAQARLNEAELARLDQDLTPMGAERAGNADGSIPAWTGKWRGAPPHVQFAGSGSAYADPYADERPLFSITAQNLEQYRERLSAGQLALFARYPKSYRLDVYPSHRDFRYSQQVEDNFRENGRSAELANGGDSVTGAWGASPFPIPKNGHELVWNLNLKNGGGGEDGIYTLAVVYANGKQARQVKHSQNLTLWSSPTSTRADAASGLYSLFLQTHLEPARALGEITFGQEFIDPIANPRQSWQYIPGTRRIRRAPNVGYDNPASGAAGSVRVNDDNRMFNGAPDRYDWKLLGKREVYIPYHNYKLDDPALKVADITATLGHPNPDPIRYELHRVWVLEGSLKPGKRHIYSRRVVYTDEDTWVGVLADNYDARGQLWRSNLQASFYAYDTQSYQPRVAVFQDLISGAYLADQLSNESRPIRLTDFDFDTNYFTPASVRKRAQ